MTTEIRNALFSEKKYLIGVTVKKHWRLIRAARLDEDDVRQELAVRLLEAIERYDPARCRNMDAYLTLQLRYRLLHMRERSALYGIPQAPRRNFQVLSLNAPNHAGLETQVPSYDLRSNIIHLEEEIAGLPVPQRNAVERLLSGGRVNSRNKALQAARRTIRERFVLPFQFQYA